MRRPLALHHKRLVLLLLLEVAAVAVAAAAESTLLLRDTRETSETISDSQKHHQHDAYIRAAHHRKA